MLTEPLIIDAEADIAPIDRRVAGSLAGDFAPSARQLVSANPPVPGPVFWGPSNPLAIMSAIRDLVETNSPGGAGVRSSSAVSPAAAIANAVKLLQADPAAAERQAKEVLRVLPEDSRALLVIGAARRRLRDFPTARRILAEIATVKHESAEAHFELGLTLVESGERDAAIDSLRRAAALETDFADAWIALSEQLYLAGDKAGATEAYDEHIRISVKDPDLMGAIAALRESRVNDAETRLRVYLRANPGDIGATRLMAEVLGRQSRYEEAEVILAHCLRLSPDFVAARFNYALVLYEQNKPEEAIVQLEKLLEKQPGDPRYLSPLAACYVLLMDYDRAVPLLERLVAERPNEAKFWINYGQGLRIVGARGEAIAAYRRAIAAEPGAGDAYWSLADLKVDALDDADIASMTAQIANPKAPADALVAFHYSLGKAHEDRRDWETSFHHYSEGARLRRRLLPNDPDQNTAVIGNLIRQFTPAFFAERADWGFADAAPIFVVGLPRAGSTLIEQILGSHSDIEATMELPLILQASSRLNVRGGGDAAYPRSLEFLPRERCAEIGAQYVAASARYRKRDTRLFVDKMPSNFFHIGLIKLILPNARIIDIRRDPMGCCFSAFKQYFFRGQNYSYDLGDIGRYYRDYVALMAHYENVLPGFIHRVHYDELVDDADGEVRRLLAFLRVDYQDACLNFWNNGLPVSTHSSEQVRRPIYRDALELWRNYEPWLGPLREGLGDSLNHWKQGASRP